jgi:hypothetical protein
MPGCGWRAIISALLALAVLGALVLPVAAKRGDKQGWSLLSDRDAGTKKRPARNRALLIYVPAKDGLRVLTFGCLRDAESFEILFEGFSEPRASRTSVTLILTNGQARYQTRGEIGFFTGSLSFDSNTIVDAKVLRQIADGLLPVLEGPGPTVVTLGPTKRDVPVAGLAEPLKRFRAACFGA